MTDRVPDCERWDRAGVYCIEGKDCTCRASSNRVADIANRIRPALNIDADGLIRVSHGQDDLAETVVRLVLDADAIPNSVCSRCGAPDGPCTVEGCPVPVRHATRNRAAVDVIAQMIRAYDGKGIAAGTFAEAIEDALAKAGYKVMAA